MKYLWAIVVGGFLATVANVATGRIEWWALLGFPVAFLVGAGASALWHQWRSR